MEQYESMDEDITKVVLNQTLDSLETYLKNGVNCELCPGHIIDAYNSTLDKLKLQATPEIEV